MTTNQINGIIRAVVPALLAYFVAAGKLPDSFIPDVTAALVALVTAGAAAWSVFSNSPKSQVASVQALPTVQVLVSDPKLLSPGVNLVSPAVIRNN